MTRKTRITYGFFVLRACTRAAGPSQSLFEACGSRRKEALVGGKAAAFSQSLSLLTAAATMKGISQRRSLPRWPLSALLPLLLMLARDAPAQEAVRASLAGEAAARQSKGAAQSVGYYNVELGDTRWSFGSTLGVSYTDNVQLGQVGQGADVSFSPALNMQMLWPLTDQNSLNLRFGGGYQAYLENSQLDRFFVTPGSEVSFDLYAGDLSFNVHDRFSISENAYQDPTVVGQGNYSQLANAAGVSVLWDLNKVILRLGYDHNTYTALTGAAAQGSGEAETVPLSAGYMLHPDMQVGVETGVSLVQTTGTNNLFTDATQWNAGCFYEAQLSEYVHVRGSVGYLVYSTEATGSASVSDSTGYYGELSLTHRLNQYVEYALTGGRSVNFGFFGGTVDLYSARLDATWKFLRNFGLTSSFSYEHGSQALFGNEVFDRYGVGMSLNRALTQKLSSTLTYQYYWRGSSLAGLDYTANILSLSLAYTF